MKAIAIISSLLVCTCTGFADTSRFVTVITTNFNNPGIIQVLDGETAEIISAQETYAGNILPISALIVKSGITNRGYPPGYLYQSNLIPRGTAVSGPATIIMDNGGGISYSPGLLTVKITPATYDPNKTLIVPPGTNRVYITLESSTNLVNWADATNGIYGSPDIARFFRIRMDKF